MTAISNKYTLYKDFQITRDGEFCTNIAQGRELDNYKLNWLDRLKLFNDEYNGYD